MSTQEIIHIVINSGYKPEQSINYAQFLSIYKAYEQIAIKNDCDILTEVGFAQSILGVKKDNFKTCKYKGANIRILKQDDVDISESQRKDIISIIIAAGYGIGQIVDYEQLKHIYSCYIQELTQNISYPVIGEKDFAEKILGIKYENYISCKYKKTKIRILKSDEVVLTQEERAHIISTIMGEGYWCGQTIDNKELEHIYDIYIKVAKRNHMPLISEKEFAQTILRNQ